MNTLSSIYQEVNHYLNEYRNNPQSNVNNWLKTFREEALANFCTKGFPTLRDEDWKYTNVIPLIKKNYKLSNDTPHTLTTDDFEKIIPFHFDSYSIVFVNGFFSKELSQLNQLAAEITITNLAEAVDSKNEIIQHYLENYCKTNTAGFDAFNNVFAQDGAFVLISDHHHLKKPIQLVFINTHPHDALQATRNIIIANNNSQATIIENYLSIGDHHYFTNTITQIHLANNAKVMHYKLIEENQNTLHVGSTFVEQAEHSEFKGFNITMGGQLVRSDTHVLLNETNAHCTLNGLYLTAGKQHIDHHTLVDHVSPHTSSQEFYKGILADQSRAVFNGKVVVRPNAFKTNAQQTNKNLLLTDGAEIDTKPQLEIYTDDVQCTHGATVGQIDQNALFYLRSRGMSETSARGALIYAFAKEIIEQISLEKIRHYLRNKLSEKLDFYDQSY